MLPTHVPLLTSITAWLAAAGLLPGRVPVAPSVSAAPGQSAPELRLLARGQPLAGQPFALEVFGTPGNSFQLWVGVRAAAEVPAASAGVIPAGRAATWPAAGPGFSVAGITGADGAWRQPLAGFEPGTELSVWGFAPAAPAEFGSLDVTVLPPYVPKPGDLFVSEIRRVADVDSEPAGPWIELANATGFDLDLSGWTLRDDRGEVQVLGGAHRRLVLPAHGYALLGSEPQDGVLATFDGFHLDPDADEIVLESPAGELIDRVAYDVAAGWPAALPGASLELDPAHFDAAENDQPGAWRQSTTSGGGAFAQAGSPYHASRCSQAGLPDDPDPMFLDTNCDGIDGDASRAIFVAKSGAPGNPGTRDLPLDDVNAAIQLAASDPTKDSVYVSEGVYGDSITLVDGVSVWGGYSASHAWQRSNAYVTTFGYGSDQGSGLVGVSGENLTAPIALGSVEVVTADAGTGKDDYGIRLVQCSDVRLESVTILTGSAGAGAAGADGLDGGAGQNGYDGNYYGTSAGGPGGYGPGYPGGTGGVGGYSAHYNGFGGAQGSGAYGGTGGYGGGWISAGGPGGQGSPGTNGGYGHPASNQGSTSAGFWVSHGDGPNGGSGIDGSGGGGGGGGSADFFGYYGNGGGGGGSGGRAGTGGTGGQAGGTSFGLFVSASQVEIQDCRVIAGSGRDGGAGRTGGYGGAGGKGGHGGTCCSTPYGGDGGDGGYGGYGGPAAGGGGGNSYAILVDAQGQITLTNTTLATAASGAGGAGGYFMVNDGLPGEAKLVKQL